MSTAGRRWVQSSVLFWSALLRIVCLSSWSWRRSGLGYSFTDSCMGKKAMAGSMTSCLQEVSPKIPFAFATKSGEVYELLDCSLFGAREPNERDKNVLLFRAAPRPEINTGQPTFTSIKDSIYRKREYNTTSTQCPFLHALGVA